MNTVGFAFAASAYFILSALISSPERSPMTTTGPIYAIIGSNQPGPNTDWFDPHLIGGSPTGSDSDSTSVALQPTDIANPDIATFPAIAIEGDVTAVRFVVTVRGLHGTVCVFVPRIGNVYGVGQDTTGEYATYTFNVEDLTEDAKKHIENGVTVGVYANAGQGQPATIRVNAVGIVVDSQ